MKTIIAGSRSISDKMGVFTCIEYGHSLIPITEVVCGMAIGVDLIGRDWALASEIPFSEWKPDYDRYGRYVAPKKRNEAMGDYADCLIAVWDGKSTGTLHMLNYMKALGKRWVFFNILDKTVRLDDRHPRKGIQLL